MRPSSARFARVRDKKQSDDKKHNADRDKAVGDDIPLQVREGAGQQQAGHGPGFEGPEGDIIAQQQRHEHQRGHRFTHRVAGGELRAAVTAAAMAEHIAEHRHKVAGRQHMAADVAVGAAAEDALAVYYPPGGAVEKAAHAGAQQGGDEAAVYGDGGGGVQHGNRLLCVVAGVPAPAVPGRGII